VSEQLDVLLDVSSRLDREAIPYMVSGSMAMNYYAQPRMTRDIDLVMEIGSRDAARLERLFAHDYYLDVAAIQTAIADRSLFNMIHLNHVVKVDCIVRKDTEYRRLEFSRRRQMEISGKIISFVSPEDLLISKLEWARSSKSELQLRDIHNLIASLTDLDWDYIREWTVSLGLGDFLREVTQ
jgi:hypothetical protein